jgi:hypothetical protein
MPRKSTLKRKSFFVDEQAIGRARKVLGVRTDSEAVRASIELIAEMEVFWRFMERSRGALPAGTIETP